VLFQRHTRLFGQERWEWTPPPVAAWNTNSGLAVFSHIRALLPLKQFHRCVECYGGARKLRSFSCLDQFLSRAFAQLTHRDKARLRGSMPSCLYVSGAHTSDASVLGHLPLEPAAGCVMDRGYIHFMPWPIS
jgi:hypothetical protein